MTTTAPTPPRSSLPAVLTAAPHRLMFFVGATNVLAAMTWWAYLWVFDITPVPVGDVPAGWLHGFIIQYQMLPSFMFGFLLTTFPRWMGQPELARRHYVPIGAGMFAGQILCLVAAFSGWAPLLYAGVALTIAGWGYGLCVLAPVIVRNRFRTWHAISCWAALLVGWIALLTFAFYLYDDDFTVGRFAIRAGMFGVLLPIYATVAHRMFPFFAARIPGYRAWNPMWILAAQWPFWILHTVLEVTDHLAWLWVADIPLMVLSLICVWKWWPRDGGPGLTRVLFIGYAWLPVGLALYVVQSLNLLIADERVLGYAPLHTLAIGMFGSLLVAMATRVTQGHSGRPLALVPTAVFAFVTLQAVVLLRIAADLSAFPYVTMVRIAAVGWVVAFLPWVVRSLVIYLRPRKDGRPG